MMDMERKQQVYMGDDVVQKGKLRPPSGAEVAAEAEVDPRQGTV